MIAIEQNNSTKNSCDERSTDALIEECLAAFSLNTSVWYFSYMLDDVVMALDWHDKIDIEVEYNEFICEKVELSKDESIFQLNDLCAIVACLLRTHNICLHNTEKDSYHVAFIGMTNNVFASIKLLNRLHKIICDLKDDYISKLNPRVKKQNKIKRAGDFIDRWIAELRRNLGEYFHNRSEEDRVLFNKYVKEKFHTTNDLQEAMQIPAKIISLTLDEENASKSVREVIFDKYSRETIKAIIEKMALLTKEDLVVELPDFSLDFCDEDL